jgi:hypothetical protein
MSLLLRNTSPIPTVCKAMWDRKDLFPFPARTHNLVKEIKIIPTQGYK